METEQENIVAEVDNVLAKLMASLQKGKIEELPKRFLDAGVSAL